MVKDTFTLILTKGMHVISDAAADQIKDALRAHEATVDVELDPFGGFDLSRVTTIVVAHVVAITLNKQHEPLPENVTMIANRKGRSISR